jgi:hypothetical protein
MHSTPASAIRLRTEQFRRRARLHGLDTDTALAAHLGINRSTLFRMLNGDAAPGEKFMAQVLAAFPELRFEDLFEVVESSAA